MDDTLPDHVAQIDRVLDELFTPEEEAAVLRPAPATARLRPGAERRSGVQRGGRRRLRLPRD